ncbi:hypothetical protein PC128_g25261 [Phytophthora cactorum]|nr:hypothetical protein PC128_g25261 [Phytophthora cactorum]
MGEGPGGWAPPLETEMPRPAEMYEEEEGACAADEARGEVEERAPAGKGQGGEMKRGTLRSADQGVRGDEAQAARDEKGSMFGIAPPSPRTMRRAESVLETLRGRELFNGFLEQLARQPTPSEGPSQGPGTTIGVRAGGVTTTTTRPRQGVTIAMDPSRPSLAPVERSRHEVPQVTPAYATPDRLNRSSGGVPTSGPGNYAGGRAERVDMGDQGTAPAQSTVSLTAGTETLVSNPAFQAFLMDALSQALQRFSTNGEPPTLPQQSQAMTPASRPRPTSTAYARLEESDRRAASAAAQYRASTTPRATLRTPASTPVGMPMAAIPPYGGVSIHVSSASVNNAEVGALRPGAFYSPSQPPMMTTSGWRATTGTIPAWSAAPAIQTSTHARAGTAGLQVPRTPQVGGVAFQDSV